MAEHDETWFTAEGYEMHPGDEVWSHKLHGSAVAGSMIREHYGVYSGFLRSSERLTLRHAAREHRCQDCGDRIDKGETHGSTYYSHYCLNCVTPKRPEDVFLLASTDGKAIGVAV